MESLNWGLAFDLDPKNMSSPRLTFATQVQ